MKIIITGATGFVGRNVLEAAIASPDITSIIVLTRRSIDDQSLRTNRKVTEIIHSDFSSYPPELMEQLKGALACIWAIGGAANKFPDLETARRVNVDFPLNAAKAFIEHLIPTLSPDEKFRFCFCSGWGASSEPTERMWIMPNSRRLKGTIENLLLDLASSDPHADRFDTYIFRPGGILPRSSRVVYSLVKVLAPMVMADVLARAFIRVATNGYKEKFIENAELTTLGGGSTSHRSS